MKKLILVCGPNGVGKSSVCRRLNERLPYSARVDSDWCRCVSPWEFSHELIELNVRNLACLLGNYLACDCVRYVIFSYGFHGPRQGIFEAVRERLAPLSYEPVPVLLTCELGENVRRLRQDGRDEARVRRAVKQSRPVHAGLAFPTIDTTHLSIDEVCDRICELLPGAE